MQPLWLQKIRMPFGVSARVGDRVTDSSAGQGDRIVFDRVLGLDLFDIAVTCDAAGATVQFGAQSMVLAGVTQPFDLGNHIAVDCVPEFDFIRR